MLIGFSIITSCIVIKTLMRTNINNNHEIFSSLRIPFSFSEELPLLHNSIDLINNIDNNLMPTQWNFKMGQGLH